MRQLDELVGPVAGDDPKVRKRRRILDAATALFLRQGYRKTSIDEVAREAGVAKGTVYLYFAKKVDLVIAAASREKRAYLRELREVFDPGLPSADRLRRYCIAVLLSATRMPLSRRLLERGELAAIVHDMPPALLASGDRFREDFVVPLIEAVAAGSGHRWTPGELTDRATVVMGLGHVSAQLAEPTMRRGLSVERYAEIMADIIVAGLGAADDDREQRPRQEATA